MRTAVRRLVRIGVVLAVVAISGCSGSGSGPSLWPTEAAQTTRPADPDAVLTQLSGQLDALIKDLSARYPAMSPVPAGDSTHDCTDSATDGEWPHRRTSVRRMSTDGGQAVAVANQIADGFTTTGWFREDFPVAGGATGIGLHKDGFALVMNAGDGEPGGAGAIALVGLTPCVNADGSVDRRTPR